MVRYGTEKYYRVANSKLRTSKREHFNFISHTAFTDYGERTNSLFPYPPQPVEVLPTKAKCEKIKIKGKRATETPLLPPPPRLASPFMLHYTTNSKQQTEASKPTTKHNTAGHGNMQRHYVSGFLPSKIRPTIANRFSTISSSSCSTISTKPIIVLCVFQILFYRTYRGQY